MLPTVSIVMPTRNRAARISGAIASVCAQSFAAWELIVVDDGSTDDTERVIKECREGRIRYLRHPASRGPAAARNSALELASGEFVAYLDDDNEWMPEFLTEMVAAIRDAAPAVAALCGKRHLGIWCEGGREHVVLDEIVLPSVLSPERIWRIKEPLDSNLLVHRRAILREVGTWDERLGLYEDVDLIMRISLRYPDGIVAVRKPLEIYYDRKGATDNLTAQGGFAVAKEYLFRKHQGVSYLEGQSWYPDPGGCFSTDRYRELFERLQK